MIGYDSRFYDGNEFYNTVKQKADQTFSKPLSPAIVVNETRLKPKFVLD